MLQDQLLCLPDLLDVSADWDDYLPGGRRKDFWGKLDSGTAAPLKAAGTAALKEPWPALPATLYMDFFRTGNRLRFENPYFRRRVLLIRMVLGYCAGEASPETLDRIIDAAGSICGEMTWVVPAHNWPHSDSLPPAEPAEVDLFAANTASLLALTVHLLKEPLEREAHRMIDRIVRECTRRCLTPYMENDGHWWMGFHHSGQHGPPNNWNPWITANFLHTLFLLLAGEYAPARGVRRAGEILNNYLDVLSPDGGCNEGPAYWNHAVGSLFDCLDILNHAAGGKTGLLSDPWFRNAASYLERMHIAGDFFVNFADCSGRLDALPSGLIGRIGAATGNAGLTALAAGGGRPEGENGDSPEEAFSTFRLVRDLSIPAASVPAGEAKGQTDCFPDLQITLFRDDAGLTLASKGGHNGESHNHNDTGHFILYGDGEPLLIDPGVGDYTRETFSEKRYTIWTMQSAWHNLPEVNGYDQAPGPEFGCGGFRRTGDRTEYEIAPSWPVEAGLASWQRTLDLERDAGIVRLTDRWRFSREENRICWNFIFLREPRTEEGRVTIETLAGHLSLEFDPALLEVSADFRDIPGEDHKMGSWKVPRIHRVSLAARQTVPPEGETVFSMTYTRRPDNE